MLTLWTSSATCFLGVLQSKFLVTYIQTAFIQLWVLPVSLTSLYTRKKSSGHRPINRVSWLRGDRANPRRTCFRPHFCFLCKQVHLVVNGLLSQMKIYGIDSCTSIFQRVWLLAAFKEIRHGNWELSPVLVYFCSLVLRLLVCVLFVEGTKS